MFFCFDHISKKSTTFMVDLQMFFMLRKGLGVSQVGDWGVAGQGFFGVSQAGGQGVAGLLTKRRRSAKNG